MTSLNSIKIVNQSEIARILQVDQSYLNKILRGKRKGPKAQEILRRAVELIGSLRAA